MRIYWMNCSSIDQLQKYSFSRIKREADSQLAPISSQAVYSLDCEMVEVLRGKISGSNKSRVMSAVARCTIVDNNGQTILDQYVRPRYR